MRQRRSLNLARCVPALPTDLNFKSDNCCLLRTVSSFWINTQFASSLIQNEEVVMLRTVPVSWFSWDFHVFYHDKQPAHIDTARIREAGTLLLDGTMTF
jgi:hypothetical protein